MTLTILPGRIAGEITAIPSKSHLHRLMIYAAFSDRDTLIECRETEAEDVVATIDCLTALGAVIGRNEDGFAVTPIDRNNMPTGSNKPIEFNVGESGSTLRFMLPIVCALGISGAFKMRGRLPKRPLDPLDKQLEAHGIKFWRSEDEATLFCEGQLKAGDDYLVPGDISSQYISGLLMALPLLEKQSRLTVTGTMESAGYVDMTLQAEEAFGAKSNLNHNYYQKDMNDRFDSRQNTEFVINSAGIYKSPGRIVTEGDWSNSAFWMCAGAMPRGNIKLYGLKKDTAQGDREIYRILLRMGVDLGWEYDHIFIREDQRYGSEVDCRAIPDLIPILAAVAAVSTGKTFFRNASRLRIKESDRITSTAKTLKILGANVQENIDGLVIEGVKNLKGGIVDAIGDHRIAMMAAIASAACIHPVTLTGAQAVNKSYPDFWKDLRALGKKAVED
jgi:3-phosphoshikimate 1-carboxyvinyltransferase